MFSSFKKIRKITDDPFIRRLRSSVLGEGMLSDGNIYLIDHAIKNLPNEGAVIEIGIYGGVSTNLREPATDIFERPAPLGGGISFFISTATILHCGQIRLRKYGALPGSGRLDAIRQFAGRLKLR